MAETTVRPNRRGQYLVVYNVVSCFLWFVVLMRTSLLLVLVGPEHVYSAVGDFVKWTQSLALLEIVHAASEKLCHGEKPAVEALSEFPLFDTSIVYCLVRAGIFTTFLQVASRVTIIWGVVHRYPREAAPLPFYSSMLIAWSLAEIFRYSYLAQHLRGEVPPVLTWLRYNAFFVLYPLGIGSECMLVWRASQVSQPPEQYAWWAALVTYVPGSYILYTHMMRQRRRIIKGKGKATSASQKRR